MNLRPDSATSKMTMKRHISTDDAIRGISNPALRRLARRGGVKRISGLIYDEVRVVLRDWLQGVVKDAIVYMEHGRRKTVMASDVVNALKKRGDTMYGYGQ